MQSSSLQLRVRGAVGTNRLQDQGEVPLAPRAQFGADTPYQPNVQAPFRQLPMYLHASNKPSEHNVFNAWPVIVVAQLAPQTSPPSKWKGISNRIHLPGGL